MRKAFTLLELLTVVAIMGLLGTASVGGYAAMQRGIRERGAVASASALLRAAKERAAIDRVPTAVICYNKMVREGDPSEDESAVVVGVMAAVRRSGRITRVAGNLLYDEFGDLDRTYTTWSDDAYLSGDGESHSVDDLELGPGMRLYKFPTGQNMEYSLISSRVWATEQNMVHLFSGAGSSSMTNVLMSAFYDKQKSDYQPSWAVGDAYAFQFAETQLPNNMVFGKNVPAKTSDVLQPIVIIFDPNNDTDNSVEINTVRMSPEGKAEKFTKAGDASSDEKKKL